MLSKLNCLAGPRTVVPLHAGWKKMCVSIFFPHSFSSPCILVSFGEQRIFHFFHLGLQWELALLLSLLSPSQSVMWFSQLTWLPSWMEGVISNRTQWHSFTTSHSGHFNNHGHWSLRLRWLEEGNRSINEEKGSFSTIVLSHCQQPPSWGALFLRGVKMASSALV